jgi:hypothetical protein
MVPSLRPVTNQALSPLSIYKTTSRRAVCECLISSTCNWEKSSKNNSLYLSIDLASSTCSLHFVYTSSPVIECSRKYRIVSFFRVVSTFSRRANLLLPIRQLVAQAVLRSFLSFATSGLFSIRFTKLFSAFNNTSSTSLQLRRVMSTILKRSIMQFSSQSEPTTVSSISSCLFIFT